jgi:hypothetical protein
MHSRSSVDSGLSKLKKLLSELKSDQSTHIVWRSDNDLCLVGLDPEVLEKLNELTFESLSRVVKGQKNAIIADVLKLHFNAEEKVEHVSSFRLSLLPSMIDEKQKDHLADSVRIEIHEGTYGLLTTELTRMYADKRFQISILKEAVETYSKKPECNENFEEALRILVTLKLNKHHDAGSLKKLRIALCNVFLSETLFLQI